MGDDDKKSRTQSVSRKFTSRNPFINFLQDFRKTNCSKGHTRRIFKLAGEQWKQMTDEEKAPYVNAARKIEKPKRKPHLKKRTARKKKFRKRNICCSKCGHRQGSPQSTAHDSLESMWTLKTVDKHSRNSGTTSDSRSYSPTPTETTVTDDDHTEASTTCTSH